MKLSSLCISQNQLFPPHLFIFVGFILFLSVWNMEDLSYIYSLKDLDYDRIQQATSDTWIKISKSQLPLEVAKEKKECDEFKGRWVRDNAHPLYEEDECPYIIPQLTCLKHGRLDKDYQHWRWQPHGCSLPSFNATLMLESLRGKTMLFVGDSLNRGQFISMVCLLHKLIPDRSKSMETTFDSLSLFVAKDYNATIGFYWAPYLLESNSDNPTNHKLAGSIVRNNSMDRHGKHWKGADVIVFNTYLWWMSDIKILKGSFEDEFKEIVAVSRYDAYRMAMKSLVSWVNSNIDPKKSKVFFRTASPSHKSSREWGGAPNGNCYNETTMIDNYIDSPTVRNIMQVTKEEFGKSRVPITILNITQLSYYRKDAHTSIHKEQWRNLTVEQLANPTSYADCIHWCLPGVQDTWNELLFSKLFYPSH